MALPPAAAAEPAAAAPLRRPSLARLTSWRYKHMGDLPVVTRSPSEFSTANAGFAHEFQLVDVPDFMGKGEMEPVAHYYQNLGEAEYIVAVFQYMRLLGFPADRISVLTTYNGQKDLIKWAAPPPPLLAAGESLTQARSPAMCCSGAARGTRCSGGQRTCRRWISSRASRTTTSCSPSCARAPWGTCATCAAWSWPSRVRGTGPRARARAKPRSPR
jgi:hypothetical protein